MRGGKKVTQLEIWWASSFQYWLWLQSVFWLQNSAAYSKVIYKNSKEHFVVHILFVDSYFNIKLWCLDIKYRENSHSSLSLSHSSLSVFSLSKTKSSVSVNCTEEILPLILHSGDRATCSLHFLKILLQQDEHGLRNHSTEQGWLTCPGRPPQKEGKRQVFSIFSEC